jgi:DNA-binding winged helix-turn-helix (wHTH) protein
VSESLPVLLLQRSEGGEPVFLLGPPDLSPEGSAAFRRLIELGVVIHERQLDTWDPCADCCCGAEARRVRWTDGVPRAICAVAHDGGEVLDPAELQLLRVSVPRLAEETAAALGMSGSAVEVQPGIFCVGELPGGRLLVLAAMPAAIGRPGALDQVRALARGRRISLVAPVQAPVARAALEERGVDVVLPAEAFLPSEPRRPVVVNIDALLAAPRSEPRLTLSMATSSVALDGHSIELPAREFELLWLVCDRARRGRPLVSSRDVLEAMYHGTTATAATVRSLKRDLQNSLDDLLKRARFPGQLVQTRDGRGYALALRPEEIALIPA